jgi:hypothetical protein
MSAYSSFLPPSSLSDVVESLESLSDSEFAEIRSAISGPHSFSLSKDEITALSKKVSVPATTLPYLLGALSFLYSHVAQLMDSGMQFPEALSQTVENLAENEDWKEKREKIQQRLSSILIKQDAHQRFRKIQRLQSGFIPNATGFASFVDLRPDFGEGDNLTFKGFVPIVQFRISTDAISPDGRRHVFQLGEQAFVELRKAVDRAEAKLKAIKEEASITSHIIKT